MTRYIEVFGEQRQYSAIAQLLQMLTCNASYDQIPKDLFEKLFVDLLLDEKYL